MGVGSCMYLSLLTRGDCSNAINQCARFIHNPGPSHIAAAKCTMRFIAGTLETYSVGLTYRRSDVPNVLSAAADADHAGPDVLQSVSSWSVSLDGCLMDIKETACDCHQLQWIRILFCFSMCSWVCQVTFVVFKFWRNLDTSSRAQQS